MKKQFLLFLLLVSSFGLAQTLNDYNAVIVPLKYDFLKSENQYRMATLSKFNLNKVGFDVYYSNQIIPSEIMRCAVLNYDIVKESGLLTTRLYVVFKDCYGKIVYQSEIGSSREKDFQLAYNEALNRAFESVYALEYQYRGPANTDIEQKVVEKVEAVKEVVPVTPEATTVVVATTAVTSNQILYAQPLASGNYQLIDNTPSIVMKIYKTSDPNSFIAQKGNQQGVLVKKDNQWFFEYYQNDQLISEKINVKF